MEYGYNADGERVPIFQVVAHKIQQYGKQNNVHHALEQMDLLDLHHEMDQARFLMTAPWKTDPLNGVLTGMSNLCLLAFEAYLRLCPYKQERLTLDDLAEMTLYPLYRRKNADYGNSFDQSLDEDGILVAKIRLGDKISRFGKLVTYPNEREVKEEPLTDTLIDMMNYAIMTYMWVYRKQKEKGHQRK
jgi:hypothetical protein